MILLVAGVIVYRNMQSPSNSTLPQLTPANSQSAAQTPREKQRAPTVVTPVSKTEDGDSQFATDLYAMMKEDERAYYSSTYYWAMTNLPNGESHSWQHGNMAGTIRPNDLFTNKKGEACRHFNEVLKVQHIQQSISGTACDNGGGSWCKLKPNATPSCGLGGGKPGLWQSITNLF